MKQLGSVEEYVRKFEELRGFMLRENPSLSESYYMHSFIRGLSEQVKPWVRANAPSTLGEAITKAHLYEVALKAGQRSFNGTRSGIGPRSGSGNSSNTWGSGNLSNTFSATSNTKAGLEQGSTKKKEPFCYTCGETLWVRGHVCKQKKVGLHAMEGEECEIDEEQQFVVEEDQEKLAELSMHAINGSMGCGTMKLGGKVRNRTILIYLTQEVQQHSSARSWCKPSNWMKLLFLA